MELEFDKEIDAMLRQEGRGRTITIGEFASPHLDADEIAAFVEDAVPSSARPAMMTHLADCDSCRRTFSNAVLLRPEETVAVAAAAAPAAETVPWYKRLFLFPNLAYVMGGLVILFAGFIGLSILTRSYRSGESELSRATSVENKQPAAPSVGTAAPYANSNSTVMSNAASSSANTASDIPVPGQSHPANSTANDVAIRRDVPADELRDAPRLSQQPVAAEPAATPASEKEDKAVDDERGRNADVALAKKTTQPKDLKTESLKPAAEAPAAAPGGAAKMKGPTRNEQRERAIARAAEEDREKRSMPAPTPKTAGSTLSADRKQISGRTFEFRQGAWYDTTYRGQGTINVRRNTDDYKRLDKGLRGIAESVIGTVVTVWNGKAYRIY